MKAHLEAVKVLELLGWEVLEVDTEYKYANLVKDGAGLYIHFETKNETLTNIDLVCPKCGRKEIDYVLNDECPQCELDWVIEKDIAEEYKTMKVKDISNLIGSIFEGYNKFIAKILKSKGGDKHVVDYRDLA